MPEQLDLLSFSLPAEELAQPLSIGSDPAVAPNPNARAIEWLEAKQLCYLRLMNRFIRSSFPQRRDEIGRLSQMRDRVLEALAQARQ